MSCCFPNRDGLHNFVQIILSRPDMLQLPEVVEFLGLDKQPEVSGEQEDEEEDMDVDSVNRSGEHQGLPDDLSARVTKRLRTFQFFLSQ